MKLQSHLERLEEQLLQQQQFASSQTTTPSSTTRNVTSDSVTPKANKKYGNTLGKLSAFHCIRNL